MSEPPIPWDPSTVGHAATAAYEETLDLEEERRTLRRTETWIFFRAFLLLIFVILAIVARSIAL
jgi:hypothetical protein